MVFYLFFHWYNLLIFHSRVLSKPSKYDISSLKKLQIFFPNILSLCIDATREIDIAVKALNAPTLDEMKSPTPSVSVPDSIMCVFNEDLLSLSVKQFIADCVQSFLIGIPSRGMSTLLASYVTLLAPNVARETKKGAAISMDDLCKKVRKEKLRRIVSQMNFPISNPLIMI